MGQTLRINMELIENVMWTSIIICLGLLMVIIAIKASYFSILIGNFISGSFIGSVLLAIITSITLLWMQL
jgi:hypothetical protein